MAKILFLSESCLLDPLSGAAHSVRAMLQTLAKAGWQARQPIFKGAVEQWKHYAKWLGPMRAAFGELVLPEVSAADDSGSRPVSVHSHERV
jgi:hypothetical protein